jgi:ubiquinone/menaquinone biosynthesis C-methylase UbiE
MTWFALPRVPEPEAMDDAGEVTAYSSAAAQAYLSKIDDTFIKHALRLVQRSPGRALDVGCGPGQIVLKLARQLRGWRFVGVDRSPNMIRVAIAGRERLVQSAAEPADAVLKRAEFLIADGNCLPFADAAFDLVLCNSVMHHIGNPGQILSEIARVAKPGGAILVRDLRRPPRTVYPFHVRWYGRHYSGLMYKLFCDSVRAAYTPDELLAMLKATPIAGVCLFTHHATHLGLERTAH